MTPAGRSTATALFLLFALVSAVLAAIIVPTYLSWAENGRIIRENREKVAAIRTSQTAFVRVKNASDRWTLFARAPEAGFLDAVLPEDALEEARTRVADLLTRHGGTLDDAEFTPGETKRTQVGTLVIDLIATLPKTAIAPFLAEFEDSPPYAFVTAFRLVSSGEDKARLTMTAQMQQLAESPL